jgi:aryl-alcohol dehydrogenase-like predicted oxidoreductase
METQPLGQTGLAVTPLGLGLAALGRPGYINLGHADDLGRDYGRAAMEARAHEVLDAAFAEGVRYFDAARSYGEAERFLSGWLSRRGLKRGEVTVGSKWGYTYTADWRTDADKHEVKDHSLAVLRRQAEESRALLGEWLNLYQIHSATLDSGVLDDLQVLAELAKVRERGWKVGLSLTGPRQAETLRKAMTCRVDGERVFDCVQATWNLLEPSCGEALREARQAGLGVIVKEALANGRLTPRNDDPAFAAKRQALETTAHRLGCDLDALALAAAMRQGDVALSGAATVGHLRANAKALALSWDAEAEQELVSLAEPADVYWRARSGLAWN